MNATQREPTAEELVAQLGNHELREDAYKALVALGESARSAVVAGLKHGQWEVRRWCALFLDHFADPAALQALKPLLHDPKSSVRLFAVHSLACDQCKPGENPVDVVPLLIERIQEDESIRVRRHAVLMLAHQHAYAELEGFFQELVDTESDRKLHKHAGIGLVFSRLASKRGNGLPFTGKDWVQLSRETSK